MPVNFVLLFNIIFYFLLNNGFSQPVKVLDSKKEYFKEVKAAKENKLIDLGALLPGLLLDLKYATIYNFTKTKLYANATTTYLRLPAAEALKKVAKELSAKGYRIKIFDAYRPYSATKQMWELIKDERYVANPKNGSNHNRGLALDLTLTYHNGNEINMGTGFDNFTDSAHHNFNALDNAILNHRKLLKSTMEKYGFKSLETEWWHYSYVSNTTFSVINIDFKKLGKWIR